MARRSLAAWRHWQAAAGPWRGWCVCPSLLSPEAYSIPSPTPSRDPRAEHLADALRPTMERPGTRCVLAVDPGLGVRVAARLANLAHAVLVLPRWPYAEAV